MINKYEMLKKKFPSLKEHVILAPYTTYKIGGPADVFIEATSQEMCKDVVQECIRLKIPYFFMGGGTNILISDKGFRGLVIKNSMNKIAIRGMRGAMQGSTTRSTVYVEAESGASMNALVRLTIEEGLSGIEMHLGLPGSVGGAIYMNSKWMQPKAFIGDAVYQATILTNSGEMKTVSQDYFHFSYGKSYLQKTHDILLSVVFRLIKKTKEQVWEIANASTLYRKETQPQGVKTAGCVFKNISEADALIAHTPNHTTSAGFLVDHAGCKNFHVGDAYVSDRHANFFVNKGNATATDMLQLIHLVKEKVFEQFQIELKEEIQFIGEQ